MTSYKHQSSIEGENSEEVDMYTRIIQSKDRKLESLPKTESKKSESKFLIKKRKSRSISRSKSRSISRSKSRSISRSRSRSISKSRSRSINKSRSRSIRKSRSRSISKSRSRSISKSRSRSISKSRSRSITKSRSRSISKKYDSGSRRNGRNVSIGRYKKHTRSRSISNRKIYSQKRPTTKRYSSRSPNRRNNDYKNRLENPEPNNCIGVFGLNKNTIEDTLWDEFSTFGKISSVKLITDKYHNKSLGFCFIYYDNIESATKAIKRGNGKIIDGSNIRVDYSITKKAHTPTPGQYKGKRRLGVYNKQKRRGDHSRSRSRSRLESRSRSRSRSMSRSRNTKRGYFPKRRFDKY